MNKALDDLTTARIHFDGRVTWSAIISALGFVGLFFLWTMESIHVPEKNRASIERLEERLERDISDIKLDIREIKKSQDRHLEVHASEGSK